MSEPWNEVLAELKRINARIDAISSTPVTPDVVLTRAEAAKQLKVSVRQLQRLVAGGRIAALPSGIARVELERYAKAPVVPLPRSVTRPMRERSAKEEADRGRAMLQLARKRQQ